MFLLKYHFHGFHSCRCLEVGVPQLLVLSAICLSGLHDIEEDGYFVSCGKSYYINASYIEDVTKKEIILRGGEHIFIPIRLQRELCIKVGDYIARRDDNYEKSVVKNKS